MSGLIARVAGVEDALRDVLRRTIEAIESKGESMLIRLAAELEALRARVERLEATVGERDRAMAGADPEPAQDGRP